jgi:hypothetical protein
LRRTVAAGLSCDDVVMATISLRLQLDRGCCIRVEGGGGAVGR